MNTNNQKIKGDASREETSFKVAWAAVKQSYHKDISGNWRENGE